MVSTVFASVGSRGDAIAPVLRINSAQPAASNRSPSGLFLTAPTSQPAPASRVSEYMLMLTAPCLKPRPVGVDEWSFAATPIGPRQRVR